jgi:hypothetical protein
MVVHAAHVILEDCTGGVVTKRAGALLWVLYQSEHKDERGKRFLETSKFALTFERSFALGIKKAGKQVSMAKLELFKKQFIEEIHDTSKRVYLTEAGEKFVIRMIVKTKRAIRRAMASLAEEERVVLANQAGVIVSGVLGALQTADRQDGTQRRHRHARRP